MKDKYINEAVNISVLTILRQGDLVKKFEALNKENLLANLENAVIDISGNSKPLLLVNFAHHYKKLEKWLIKLDQTEPRAARNAARVLVDKLSAVCAYYNSEQRKFPHQQLAGKRMFGDFLQHKDSGVVAPSDLLKACQRDFEQALAPITDIDLVVKGVIMAGCALLGAAALMAACITAVVFLPQFIPALQPIVDAVASPIPHVPPLALSEHFDLLTIGNAVSSGVGALMGAGAGFFAMQKIQRSRLHEFHACLDIINTITKKIDNEQPCTNQYVQQQTKYC